MQKKSLLVALFFGALCLTGCLKNEESASVAQVRIAKAEELKAAAALKNAKAQAEVIYANAEAKLKEAQAALINAQAETEKVRAELLKVQVKLQEVKVDEEKVVLQKMQAELEVLLAKAEAQKQFWVNELNNLIAQAQKDAIDNAQKLIEAQADVEAYILTLEGAKADSAKVYADLYFKTLDEIEKLQVEELKYKATRTLVNQGAVLAREFIYDEIEANNKQIAQNEAIIAHLQSHQSMTPEEAQAALAEARENLNVAYNAYMDAFGVAVEAATALEEVKNKTADYTHGWSSFKNDIKNIVGDYYGHYASYDFEEEGVTEPVFYSGMWVDDEFVPMWRYEQTFEVGERYPDVDVYEKDHSDHIHLTKTLIAPAKIYEDNINTVLGLYAASEAVDAALKVVAFKEAGEEKVAEFQEEIAANEEAMALHQEYVDARAKTAEELEEAYLLALDKQDTYESEKAAAWEAFQEYMLVNYDVTRKLFTDRYEAQVKYDALKKAEDEAAEDVSLIKDGIALAKKDVEDAVKAEAEAEGAYHLAVAKAKKADEGEEAAYETAKAKWSPEFDASNGTIKCNPSTNWYYKEGADKTTVNAGSAQNETLRANAVVEAQKEEVARLAALLVRFPDKTPENANYTDEKYPGKKGLTAIKEIADTELTNLTKAYNTASGAEATAKTNYETAKKAYDLVYGDVEKDKKVWNPDFSTKLYGNVVNIDAKNNVYEVNETYYNKKEKKWMNPIGKAVAGTAQVDVIEAVEVVGLALYEVSDEGETGKAYKEAKKKADDQKIVLDGANAALIEALGGDPAKAKIEDYLDEEAEKLYAEYLAIKDDSKVDAAWNKLNAFYHGFNPDEIDEWENGKPQDDKWNSRRTAQYSWLRSNYMVNYTATMLNREGESVLIARRLFHRIPSSVTTVAVVYNVEEGEFDVVPTTTYYDENGNVVEDPKDAERVPNFTRSLDYKNEVLEQKIAHNDDLVAEAEELAENYLNGIAEGVKEIAETVGAYKAHEESYNAWLDLISESEFMANEAQKDVFDAEVDYKAAKAEYDAVEAIANEGMWVYDPEMKIEGLHNEDGFTFVQLNEAIAAFEAENEELAAENEFYRNVLTDGKKVLTVVNEIIDQKIQVVSDNIEILATIAYKYRAIMNAYLGIVEGEGEGDEDVE